LAYVLMWAEVDRAAQTQLLAASVARAMGAEAEVPDLVEVRERFDDWLCSAPAPDSDEAVMRRALGLRRAVTG
jgi:hypothetical protein